jgi:hypothetical protein
MYELLSHRGLGARAQCESCGLYRRIAGQQLCECLDHTTGSASDVTYPHSSHHYATIGNHPYPLGYDVTQQVTPKIMHKIFLKIQFLFYSFAICMVHRGILPVVFRFNSTRSHV